MSCALEFVALKLLTCYFAGVSVQDGPSQFVGASQVPLPTQARDDSPSASNKLPENSFVRQFSQSPTSSVRGDTSEVDPFPDVPQSKVPSRAKQVSPSKSKQMVEELDDLSSKDDSDDEYAKQIAALKAKRAQSRSRKKEDEAYKSITAAARVVEEAAERTERASRDAAIMVERAAREAAERATAAARAATDLSKSGQRPAFRDFIRSETRTFDDYVPPPQQTEARSGDTPYHHSAIFEDESRGIPRSQPDLYESGPRGDKSEGVKVIPEEKRALRQEYRSRHSAHDDSEEEREELMDSRGSYRRRSSDGQSSTSPVQHDAYSPTGYEVDAALMARMAKLCSRDEPSVEEEGIEEPTRITQRKGEGGRSSEVEELPRSERSSISGRHFQPSKEKNLASEHLQAEEVSDRGSDSDFRPVAKGSMMRDQRSPPVKQGTDDIFNTVDPSSPLERSLRGKTSSGLVRYDSYNDAEESHHRTISSKSLTKSNSSSSEGGMSSVDLFDLSVREVQDHGWPRERPLSSRQRVPGVDDAECTTRDLYARGSKPQPESRRSSLSESLMGQIKSNNEEALEGPTFLPGGLPPPPGHPSRYSRPNSPAVSKALPSPLYDDAPLSVRSPVNVPAKVSPASRQSPVLSPPSRRYPHISGPPPPQRPPPPVEVSPSFKRGSSRGSRPAPSPEPMVSDDDSDSSEEPAEGSRGSGLPDIDNIEAQFKR